MLPVGSTDSHSNALSIQKLKDDSTNWLTYRTRLETAVASKGLTRHLQGRVRVPQELPTRIETDHSITVLVKGSDPADTAAKAATEAEIEENEKSLDDYSQKEATVKQLIFGSISDRRLIEVRDLSTAAKVWAKLRQLHEGRSEMVATDKRTVLQNMRLGEKGDLRLHLDGMVKIRSELSEMGSPVDNRDFAAMLVASINSHPTYRLMLTALMAVARQANLPLTPDNIIDHLRAEADNAEVTKGQTSRSSSALVASEGRQSKGRGKRSKRQDDDDDDEACCFNCGKRGHWKRDCYAKGGGKEGQGPRQRGKQKKEDSGKSDTANIAYTSSEVVPGDVAFVCTSDFAAAADAINVPAERRGAIIDCGASRHFSPSRDKFVNFRTIKPHPVGAADGRSFYATGCGDMVVDLPNGSQRTRATLKDVLYAPNLSFTLISVTRLDKAGYSVEISDGMCSIRKPRPERTVIARIPESAGLYRVAGLALPDSLHANVAHPVSISTLHRQYGHISHRALVQMVKLGMIKGVDLDFNSEPSFCETCVKAKITRKPLPQATETRATEYGGRVHSDLWGPAPVESIGHSVYMITFTDDHTRESRLYYLKKKSENFTALKHYHAWVKKHRNKKGISILRSDRGGDYLSDEYDTYLKDEGITRELTVHDTPEQDGVSERLNRTVTEIGRALLIGAGLPKFLWAEAFNHAVWLKNRASHTAMGRLTPYEAATGRKPDLSGLQEFGATVYVKVKGVDKLDQRAAEGKFMGFDEESKGVRVYWPGKRTVTVEREVRFDPDEVLIPVDYVGDEG